MSPRTLGLTAGAVVILGGLVYLFVQVQADPVASATVGDPPPRPRPTPAAEPSPAPEDSRPVARVERPDPIVATGGKPTSAVAPDPELDVDLEAAMDEANKHYDHGDYESAYKQAVANLKRDPTSIRMLRVATSSACMMGDREAATRHQAALPERDQLDMARRCERFDIKLPVGESASDSTGKRAAGP